MDRVIIPRTPFEQLKRFFSTEEKPLSYTEMYEFWSSLTLSERHYYLTQKIF